MKLSVKIGLFVLFSLSMLFFFILMIASFSSVEMNGNVAVIPINGVISTFSEGGFGFSSTPSSTIVEFIESANKDDSIKAIVLEINSPGGAPVASKEIADALSKTTKPSVAVIREVGASGAYWVASAADTIYANDISVVGSIGVLASYIEFAGLLQDYNVTYERVVGGKYKDIGSPYKELSTEERVILQKHVDLLHAYFIHAVALNRNMSDSEIKKLATGEFWLGAQAKELGLVDELGDMTTVKDSLEKKLGYSVEFVRYEKEQSIFDLLSSFSYNHGFAIGQGATHQLEQASATLRT